MNYGSSFCFTCKSTFKSGLCKFSIPEGQVFYPRRAHLLTTSSSQSPLSSVSAIAKTTDAALLLLSPQSRLCGDPVKRWYPVRWPGPCALPRAIRCCRQHRLCSHSQQALPACLPTERDRYIWQITVPDMAACENLSPTAFLQRNMRSYVP